jgi:hypothetical protein
MRASSLVAGDSQIWAVRKELLLYKELFIVSQSAHHPVSVSRAQLPCLFDSGSHARLGNPVPLDHDGFLCDASCHTKNGRAA